MGTHDFKYNKVPLFARKLSNIKVKGLLPPELALKKMPLLARKPLNINDLRSSTPKLALLPANRYNCDV